MVAASLVDPNRDLNATFTSNTQLGSNGAELDDFIDDSRPPGSSQAVVVTSVNVSLGGASSRSVTVQSTPVTSMGSLGGASSNTASVSALSGPISAPGASGPISAPGTSATRSSSGRPSQSSPVRMPPPTGARRSLSDAFGADFSIIQTPTRSMTRVKGARKRSFVDQTTTNHYTELKVIKNTYRLKKCQICYAK